VHKVEKCFHAPLGKSIGERKFIAKLLASLKLLSKELGRVIQHEPVAALLPVVTDEDDIQIVALFLLLCFKCQVESHT